MSSSGLRKVLTTESVWNPKVTLTRALVSILPDTWLFSLKKLYYPLLLSHGSGPGESDIIIVNHLVSLGDHVLDIGASIGGYTKSLSDFVGPTGMVYSFEPLPPTFEILTLCVRRLRLTNVKLCNQALSDSEGFADMVVPLYKWGTECYYDARVATDNDGKPLRHFRVASTTIDSLFPPSGPRISFVKCDANYHELHVIRGSLRMIRESKPAMLIEIGTNPDESVAWKLFDILRIEGYQPYYFDGVALRKQGSKQRTQNWFFLSDPHVALLQQRCPNLLNIA